MSNMYRSGECLNNSISNPLWADCCQSANASATEQSTQKYLRKTHVVSLKELQAWPKKKFLQINQVYFLNTAFFLQFYLHARVESDCWILSLSCFAYIVLIVWTVLTFKLLTAKGWWFLRCCSPFYNPRECKSCDFCWSIMFSFSHRNLFWFYFYLHYSESQKAT